MSVCAFGDNFCQIVEHWDVLVPKNSMTADERFNTLVRLSIFLFLLLHACKFKYSVYFLLISILVILLLYFSSSKEPFAEMNNNSTSSFQKANSSNLFASAYYNPLTSVYPNTQPLDFGQPLMNTLQYKPASQFTPISFVDADSYCQNKYPMTAGTGTSQSAANVPATPPVTTALPPAVQATPIDFSAVSSNTTSVFAQYNNRPELIDSIPEKRYLTSIQPGIYTYTDTNESANAKAGIGNPNILPNRRRMDVIGSDGPETIYFRSSNPVNFNDPTFDNDNANLINSRRLTVKSANPMYDSTPIYTSDQSNIAKSATFYDTTSGQTQFIFEQDPNDLPGYNKPKFLARSNVDVYQYETPMGQTDSALRVGSELSSDQVFTPMVNSYVNDTNDFRSNISESLMRKVNAVSWQSKAFPIY